MRYLSIPLMFLLTLSGCRGTTATPAIKDLSSSESSSSGTETIDSKLWKFGTLGALGCACVLSQGEYELLRIHERNDGVYQVRLGRGDLDRCVEQKLQEISCDTVY